MAAVSKYGLDWPEGYTPLDIEFQMIRSGGYIKSESGVSLGNGKSFHYEAARKIIWPELDDHRWNTVCRDEIARNRVTVLLGPGSSSKTHTASWIRLIDYFTSPNDTCVLVSSTDMRGLKLRIWGEITSLWQRAVERFPELPGHMLESRIAITTDSLQDGDFDSRTIRDMRKGLIGIPTVQGGKQVGLAKWIGIKQKNVHLIADEAQAMSQNFLSAFANLNKNENFTAIVLGNPNDPLDPLGRAAEPLDGWTNHMEPDKTTVWKTRFMNGTCVNLVGTDSPNFDFPKTRYKYLISKEKIEDTLSFFPKDSFEYYSQCVGVMKVGTLARRVVTRDLCIQFHALEPVTWAGSPTIKLAGLDAAYSGDRCVLGEAEIGQDVSGQTVIAFGPQVIVPVLATGTMPEDQIANYVRDYCDERNIPPENFFHDSTGRGSLGTALARVWSAQCNPVEFGGVPTERPVSMDLLIYDPELHHKRPKTCREHYRKFVTELWFSVRYAIEADQIRGLPPDAMQEMCMREWDDVNGKKELESKADMKERVGYSPDLADCCAIIVEGARRLGFVIKKLGNQESESRNLDMVIEYRDRMTALRKAHTLSYR